MEYSASPCPPSLSESVPEKYTLFAADMPPLFELLEYGTTRGLPILNISEILSGYRCVGGPNFTVSVPLSRSSTVEHTGESIVSHSLRPPDMRIFAAAKSSASAPKISAEPSYCMALAASYTALARPDGTGSAYCDVERTA